MNKEKLLERIKLLETEREQVRANLIVYEGAIQDCNYWLKELDVKNNPDKSSKSAK